MAIEHVLQENYQWVQRAESLGFAEGTGGRNLQILRGSGGGGVWGRHAHSLAGRGRGRHALQFQITRIKK